MPESLELKRDAIVITVRGGCVVSVHSGRPHLRVYLVDYDENDDRDARGRQACTIVAGAAAEQLTELSIADAEDLVEF